MTYATNLKNAIPSEGAVRLSQKTLTSDDKEVLIATYGPISDIVCEFKTAEKKKIYLNPIRAVCPKEECHQSYIEFFNSHKLDKPTIRMISKNSLLFNYSMIFCIEVSSISIILTISFCFLHDT